eukprot:Selendium_serpulae@DN4891_c0_g1_i1.p1
MTSSITPSSSASSAASPVTAVKAAFEAAVRSAFPDAIVAELRIDMALSDPKFGDYQCNSAMALFKKHKKALADLGFASPKAVGAAIEAKLADYLTTGTDADGTGTDADGTGTPKLLAKAGTAPQGFVTVTLNNEWLAHVLKRFVKEKITYTVPESKKVLFDMSSPNIAKEMHVGHLRSTIIGETFARVFEFCGHSVVRVNHIGDWGTQFGMLIENIRDTVPDFVTNPPDLGKLAELYVNSKKRFDEEAAFKSRAKAAVVLLQGGDEFARAVWKTCKAISMADFNNIYKRLGFSAEEKGESFYNSRIPGCVEFLESKKLLEDVDGCKMLFTESPAERKAMDEEAAEKAKEGKPDHKKYFPLIVVKADGGYGYDSTDLTAIRYRFEEVKADWVIYITEGGQNAHFEKLFKTAEIAGWHKPPATRCDHVTFGVVKGEDNKKFASRSGKTIRLKDLLDEAVSRARAEIDERYKAATTGEEDDESGTGGGFTEAEKQHAAECLGYSAVKYFDMKQNLTTDYVFSYDQILNPKGNTATYLMYAYARMCAIFRKAKVDRNTVSPDVVDISAPEERSLALELLRLFEVLELINKDLDVSRLTKYTYALCGAFTSFYSNCQVVGSPQQQSRLALCQLTLRFLEVAFGMIGIQALERL